MTYYIFFITIGILTMGLLPKKVAVWIVAVLLILFAGSRLNIDNDYGLYANYFANVTENFAYFRENAIVELCIYIIPNLIRLFTTNPEYVVHAGFMIFAVLGVGLKMQTITKQAEFFFFSVLLYFTNLYFIQEMTTIRAGVAAAICLWSVKDFVDKRYWIFGVKIALSFLFHNSTMFFLLALIPVFFNIKLKYYYFGLIAALGIVFMQIDIVELLRLDVIFPRAALYLSIMEWQEGAKVNIFNFRIIIALVFTMLFAFRNRHIADSRYYGALYRINLIALIIFFSLSLSADTFSLRSYELLSVVQILLFPAVIKLFPRKIIIGQVILIAVILFQMYYTVDMSGIFAPYESWLF